MTQQLAYICGVIKGDGWLSKLTIGLRVKDQDFCQAFASAVSCVFGASPIVRLDERGYWLYRRSNKTGMFNRILNFRPTTMAQKRAWLRGLFDSEGNAQLRKTGVTENSIGRRVSMYSTCRATLRSAAHFLEELEIDNYVHPVRNSAGHKGRRRVYELLVRGSQSNYRRFAIAVGSSVQRKHSILRCLPSSYSDPAAYCRVGQLRGAMAKHNNLLTVTVPRVLNGIRELVSKGIKPTQRTCRAIAGYNSVQRHFKQADLVEMAGEVACAVSR